MGDHHTERMVCMKDGTCHKTMANGQHTECQCHKKHGDRPFYCSCDASGTAMLSSIQLSKVLLPEPPTAKGDLSPRLIYFGYNSPTPAPSGKEIFHPPQSG
ncbi:MAG: hypothetical protein U5K69_01380 [Balneolaceae bacterium]|nr:hypothetical protein [Balneolaceae bacterium]